MTDRSDPSEGTLADLVGDVLGNAAEIAPLDAPRAEAWASEVLALAADVIERDPERRLVDALNRVGGGDAAVALLALGGLVDVGVRPETTGAAPAWAAAIGTSRCEGAWALRVGPAVSIAFRFVDVHDDRHVISVDLLPGPPETVGEVAVGPGDLLDVLEEDDAGIDSESAGPADLAARCVAALQATERPRWSAVVNGRLLLARLSTLAEIDGVPPVFVEDEVPPPPQRDPGDDAYALEVLEQALGPPLPGSAIGELAEAARAVAGVVAPTELTFLDPVERDAVVALEWADWLGAVIGLVRAGPGTPVDGAAMVDFVNRCPEVTTTIPKRDRGRIEWAFDVVMGTWPEAGFVDEGRITELGVSVLPAALRAAWSPAGERRP